MDVRGLKVEYQAPGLGVINFGWEGDLTLDGQPIPLSGYPRFNNPYAQVEFNSGVYHIRIDNHILNLNFYDNIREVK